MALLIANSVLVLVALLLARLRGGRDEAIGAAAILAMVAVEIAGHALLPRRLLSTDPVALAADAIGLVAFFYLAMTTRKLWPLWAASFQILGLLSHLVRTLDLKADVLTYWTMKTAPGTGTVICLLLGSILHVRNSRFPGSWKDHTSMFPSRPVAGSSSG